MAHTYYYTSVTTHWPTYADGRLAQGADDPSMGVIYDRISNLSLDHLKAMCISLTGEGLDTYGECHGSEQERPADLDDRDSNAVAAHYLDQGAKVLRRDVTSALRRLFVDSKMDLSFDGRRWSATTGGVTTGDDPSQTYSDLWLLDVAQVCERPLDADSFNDDVMLAVAAGMLDQLVSAAVAAVGSAKDIPADLVAQLGAELERARCDIGTAAGHLRDLHDHFLNEAIANSWNQTT
jgi:hypothetical protein